MDEFYCTLNYFQADCLFNDYGIDHRIGTDASALFVRRWIEYGEDNEYEKVGYIFS